MPRENLLEIANFHCRFGERLVLLDLVEEVLLPAFLTSDRVRTYGDTRYFFHSQEILFLGSGNDQSLAVAGRFIKDTTLRRDQFFDPAEGLVQDEQSLRSAPSALFVLLVDTHRLLYLPETAHAPTLSNLEATARSFLRSAHGEFINAHHALEMERYEADPTGHARPTKKALREEFPPPTLDVIPIAGEAELQDFVAQYEILKRAEVELVSTNDEIDNDEFFQQVRQRKEEAGAARTKLTHSNPRGLQKEHIFEQLDAAAQQGNSRIKLAGNDAAGDSLVGSNESFRIRVPVGAIADTVRDAARAMIRAYRRTTTSGTVPLIAVSEGVRARLRDLVRRARRRLE